MVLKKEMNKKGEIEFDTLMPWIIAIGVLVLMAGVYWVVSGKGSDSINFLKDLFRFGR